MDIKNGLEKNGHQVLIAYGRDDAVNDKEDEANNVIKITDNAEILIHAGMTRLTGITGFYSPIATIRLKKLIDNFKPEIIHFHEMHGYFVNIYAISNYVKAFT